MCVLDIYKRITVLLKVYTNPVTVTKKKHCFDCVILSVGYYSKNRDGKNYWLSGFFLFVVFCLLSPGKNVSTYAKVSCGFKSGIQYTLMHISIGASVIIRLIHLFKPPLFPTAPSLEIDPNRCQFPWDLKS